MKNKYGRPPNGKVDKLNIQAWFNMILSKLELNSAGAMERYYKEEQPNFDKETYINSNKFKNYQEGRYFPSEKIVDWFEDKVTGSKKILTSFFWKFLKNPEMKKNELFSLIEELPFDISVYLTLSKKNMRYYNKVCNLDALAGCLVIISESRNHFSVKPGKQYYPAISMGLRIFYRVFSDEAFKNLSQQIFTYLNEYYFRLNTSSSISPFCNLNDFHSCISKCSLTLQLINDLNILTKIKIAPIQCLYIAEKYLNDSILTEIYLDIKKENWKIIKKHSEIIRLTRSLKRWERNEIRNKVSKDPRRILSYRTRCIQTLKFMHHPFSNDSIIPLFISSRYL